MYHPYFRGKQFDLLALKTLIENDLLSAKILPIIEPVKLNPALAKLLQVAQKKQRTIYLIQNPQAGAFMTTSGEQTLQQMKAAPALILDGSFGREEMKADLLITQQYNALQEWEWQKNQTKVLVPLEFRLLQKVRGPKILSQDPFTRLAQTEYYAEIPDEIFSTAHLTYQKRGFVGFSDFSIDSRRYYEKGYPSSVLSLHLVYFAADTLRIHHFLSPADLPTQKEQFLALMEEIAAWEKVICGSSPTLGFNLLLTNASQGKFPGMGVMRKAAVMHHMETIGRFLDGS